MDLVEEDLLKAHARRLERAGKQLWKEFQRSFNCDKVSGELALRICNSYGFAPKDVIFIFHSHGAEIDLREFVKLYNEQVERAGKRFQCAMAGMTDGRKNQEKL